MKTNKSKDSMKIQSIIFNKIGYTLQQAKNWLKRHGFKTYVDEKEKTYRFRQENPKKFKIMRTINFKKNIKAIVGK